MVRKKIKLEEQAINEMLVADTHSESGAEASDIEDCTEEEAVAAAAATSSSSSPAAAAASLSRSWNHKQQRVADYQPMGRLKEHKYSSFCRSSKRCKKSEAPHINKKFSSAG